MEKNPPNIWSATTRLPPKLRSSLAGSLAYKTPLDSLDLVLEGECIATAIVPGAVVYCPLHTNAKKAVVFIRKSLQEKRIHIQGTKTGVWFGA